MIPYLAVFHFQQMIHLFHETIQMMLTGFHVLGLESLTTIIKTMRIYPNNLQVPGFIFQDFNTNAINYGRSILLNKVLIKEAASRIKCELYF